MVEVPRQRGWGWVRRGGGPGKQYVTPQERISAFTSWSLQRKKELHLGGDRGQLGYLTDGGLDLWEVPEEFKRVT